MSTTTSSTWTLPGSGDEGYGEIFCRQDADCSGIHCQSDADASPAFCNVLIHRWYAFSFFFSSPLFCTSSPETHFLEFQDDAAGGPAYHARSARGPLRIVPAVRCVPAVDGYCTVYTAIIMAGFFLLFFFFLFFFFLFFFPSLL